MMTTISYHGAVAGETILRELPAMELWELEALMDDLTDEDRDLWGKRGVPRDEALAALQDHDIIRDLLEDVRDEIFRR